MSPADLELLRQETRVLWGRDSLGASEPPVATRLVPTVGDEQLLAGDVDPDELAAGPWTGGPSYLAVPPTAPVLGVRTAADGPLTTAPAWDWDAAEWAELMAGVRGPWAVIIDAHEVVAWCFCSRVGPDGVEAGVATRPDHRRRGHAARVVAAWADQVARGDRPAFYSTSADNLASQAVAGHLGFRPLGWIWQLRQHVDTP